MRNLSRRTFLLASATVPLAGCSTISGIIGNTTSSQQIVTALQAVATEITQVIPQLSQVPGFAGNTLTAVQQVVAEIQQVLSGVSSAITQGQGQSILIQVENYINDLAPLVLPFVSLIPGGSIIGMVVAALPAIEAAAGVVASALSNLSKSIATSAPPLPASARLRATTPISTSQQYLNLLEQRASVRYSHRLRAH